MPEQRVPELRVIVIGASAGGVEAISRLVRELPADLPAAVCVVLHFPANGTSVLPRILHRVGSLPAAHARDGEPLEPGRIYVAPPDRHLIVRQDRVELGVGPKENNHRPAVDVLFRTAARNHGNRVIGVVLSGTLDDGTVGLAAIRSHGGLAVVQNPEDALYAGMPRSAVENVGADHVLPVAEIGALLGRLALEPAPEAPVRATPPESDKENFMDEMQLDGVHAEERPGKPAGFSCPECDGVLWELQDRDLIRFRCRVGHAYSAETLLAAQKVGLEAALWSALNALEEKAVLARRLAERAAARRHEITARQFEHQFNEALQRAELIRQALGQATEEAAPAASHA